MKKCTVLTALVLAIGMVFTVSAPVAARTNAVLTEAEALEFDGGDSSIAASVQSGAGHASGQAQLFWDAAQGQSLIQEVSVGEAGTYQLYVGIVKAGDFGIFDIYVGDTPAAEHVNAYAAAVETEKIALGEFETAGDPFTVRFVSVGKDDASAGYRISLDYYLVAQTDAGTVEAEDLPVSGDSVQTMVQSNQELPSARAQLLWLASVDQVLTQTIPVEKDGTYALNLGVIKAGDFGMFDISVNGTPVLQNVNLYAAAAEPEEIALGEFESKDGAFVIQYTCVGKDEQSAGYYGVLDYYELTLQPGHTQTGEASMAAPACMLVVAAFAAVLIRRKRVPVC